MSIKPDRVFIPDPDPRLAQGPGDPPAVREPGEVGRVWGRVIGHGVIGIIVVTGLVLLASVAARVMIWAWPS